MADDVIRTVDIAVIYHDFILLIVRTKEPFMNRLVLPGGHVEAGESLLDAAVRELEEEIGLRLEPSRLRRLVVLNAPGRDPRPGRRISTVFAVSLVSNEEVASSRAGSDAASLHWCRLSTLLAREIGFDHFQAIRLLL